MEGETIAGSGEDVGRSDSRAASDTVSGHPRIGDESSEQRRTQKVSFGSMLIDRTLTPRDIDFRYLSVSIVRSRLVVSRHSGNTGIRTLSGTWYLCPIRHSRLHCALLHSRQRCRRPKASAAFTLVPPSFCIPRPDQFRERLCLGSEYSSHRAAVCSPEAAMHCDWSSV